MKAIVSFFVFHRILHIECNSLMLAYLVQWRPSTIKKWIKAHPGRCVTQFQVGGIFMVAFVKAATMQNVVNVFSKCGIHPMNPTVFDRDAMPGLSEILAEIYPNPDNCDHTVHTERVTQNMQTSEVSPLTDIVSPCNEVDIGHTSTGNESNHGSDLLGVDDYNDSSLQTCPALIVSGTLHQWDVIFSKESRRRQCVANALCSILRATIGPPVVHQLDGNQKILIKFWIWINFTSLSKTKGITISCQVKYHHFRNGRRFSGRCDHKLCVWRHW